MARGGSGYSNPMQEHHKKARQKELQRNKQKRTKERDERALQTKTVKDVKEEIQKLERDIKRHHHGQQQKSTAEHKLARLRKELKLIQEAEAAARAKADADAEAFRLANRYRQPKQLISELDDPRKSVYYDKIMNPFGAPPPGKPRLYHSRYGGVTQNIQEASVPGEVPPPLPPPPPRNARNMPTLHHQRPQGSTNDRQHNNHHPHHQQQRSNQAHQQQSESSSIPPPTPQRQPLHLPPVTQSQSSSKTAQSGNDTNKREDDVSLPLPVSTSEDKDMIKCESQVPPSDITDTNPKIPTPSAIPSLPAPSAAVQRTMRVARNKKKLKGRGRALADIWASTEEVEYERVANQVDLEADDLGTAKVKSKKKKKKKKKPPLEFYYKDNAGNIQGPFSKAQMRSWMNAGYFPLTTKTRTNRMDPDGWVPMGDLPSLKEPIEEQSSSPPTNSVQDRIAALRDTGDNKDETDDGNMDSSMLARIAAMRADLMASSTSENPRDHDSNDDSIQDRIAALRGSIKEDDNSRGDNDDTDDVDLSMEARIASMKADMMTSTPTNVNDDNSQGDSIQDRIAALRGSIKEDDNSRGDNDDTGGDVDLSMEARIASMKADLMTSTPTNVNDDNSQGDSIQDRIAALRGNIKEDDYSRGDNDDRNDIDQLTTASIDRTLSLQDRIAILRKGAPPPPPPPPPAYSVGLDHHETGASAYPIGDGDGNGMAAYPFENGDSTEVAAYPTTYPSSNNEDDGVAAYSIELGEGIDDGGDAVAPYPTDEAYPEAEDLAYPVTDSYPVDSDGNISSLRNSSPYVVEGIEDSLVATSKNTVKVEKALVSFIPSHLQNKKRKAGQANDSAYSLPKSAEDTKQQKKAKSSTNAVAGSDDRYNQFMEEIEGL